jgi:hypothetical protein
MNAGALDPLAASSPITPLARLTMKIFFSSMILHGWILFTGWPKMLRIAGSRSSPSSRSFSAR